MGAMIVLLILAAGCSQPAAPAPAVPAAVQTTPPATEPATTAATAAVPDVPQEVVTVVHQVSQQKDVRDSALLFTLRVPVEWNVSTWRLGTSDPEVTVYRTSLRDNNVFYIDTYTVSRSQDQAYRDRFRKWNPAPAETTITIHDITYDRFESDAGGKTTVAYVARKGSANERGYASVIVFTADDSRRFEKEDFEGVVSSFRYFSADAANTTPGQEIERTNPPFEPSAGLSSGTGGVSDAGSGGGCSRCGK